MVVLLSVALFMLIGATNAPVSSEPELAQARLLLNQGKLQEAESAARQFATSHPTSADGHRLLGYILFKENNPKDSLSEYLASGHYASLGAPEFEVMGCDYFLLENYSSADEWLTRAIDSGNKNALALYLLGRAKYNERRFQEAVTTFEQSLQLDPSNVKALTYLGRAYEQEGQTQAAITAYQNAIAESDKSLAKDAEPYLSLGTLLVDSRRPQQAILYLRKGIQLAPDLALAHRELGKAYLAVERANDARVELETAAKLEPANAATHFLLAQAYQKIGLAENAKAEQERFRQLSGTHASTDDPLSEARELVRQSKFADAERTVREYLDLHKNSADAHYLLGYILFKKLQAKASLAEYTQGARYRNPSARDLEAVAGDYVLLADYADADKWFSKSLELDPGDWQVLYYLGRTKYNENRFEEAVNIFQRCLELRPKNVKAEDNLGLSLEGLGRTEEAIAAYKAAAEWEASDQERDAGPYLDLGSLLLTSGHAADAVSYFRQALNRSPNDVRIHRELGKAYLNLNELDLAQAELEKSVQLAPDHAPTHFTLAQLYRRRGLTDKAQAELERFKNLGGSHSVADSH